MADHRDPWKWDTSEEPQSFLYDTTTSGPAVRSLANGCGAVVKSAKSEFEKTEQQFRKSPSTHGSRLWFWNLVSTLTMDKLVKSGKVKHYGNGQFRFIMK